MALAQVVSVNENFIQVYNNKNIKLLSQNLVLVTLEMYQCIRKIKKNDLGLKVVIPGPKSGLPFITITKSHFVVSNS